MQMRRLIASENVVHSTFQLFAGNKAGWQSEKGNLSLNSANNPGIYEKDARDLELAHG